MSCLGVLGGLSVGCVGGRLLTGEIEGSYLTIPIRSFEGKEPKGYVIVQHPNLRYPICLYRFSQSDYVALWMRCTHQGTELQVFGDRVECPAHGSAFDSHGRVQNGPADANLRSFPVEVEDESIKIDLS